MEEVGLVEEAVDVLEAVVDVDPVEVNSSVHFGIIVSHTILKYDDKYSPP